MNCDHWDQKSYNSETLKEQISFYLKSAVLPNFQTFTFAQLSRQIRLFFKRKCESKKLYIVTNNFVIKMSFLNRSPEHKIEEVKIFFLNLELHCSKNSSNISKVLCLKALLNSIFNVWCGKLQMIDGYCDLWEFIRLYSNRSHLMKNLHFLNQICCPKIYNLEKNIEDEELTKFSPLFW